MPIAEPERARRMIIGRYADWVKRFDVNEYVQNPPMIEKLYEEKQLAFTSAIDLERQVKDLESRIHELNLQNQRLELKVSEVSHKSFLMFALSLLATVLAGIGVNIATSLPNSSTGWVMIVAACLLEGMAFLLRPQKSN